MLKKFALILITLSAIGLPLASWARPAQVLIIRHGEKPDQGNDLNSAGQARAAALPRLFTADSRFRQVPVAIWATQPSSEDPSNRPVETVTPLAQALGLTINQDFTRMQTQQLADKILNDPAYDGKTVLICWEHKVIPDIAIALGASDVPNKWHGAVFDRVWKLTFSNSGSVEFENLPQRLMPGDDQQ